MLAGLFFLLDLDLAFLKQTWTCPLKMDLDLRIVDLDLAVAGLVTSLAISIRAAVVKCSGCDKMCDAENCLKCDICNNDFDQQCSTLPKSVFSMLMMIVKFTG